jgi:hypothetical protein
MRVFLVCERKALGCEVIDVYSTKESALEKMEFCERQYHHSFFIDEFEVEKEVV